MHLYESFRVETVNLQEKILESNSRPRGSNPPSFASLRLLPTIAPEAIAITKCLKKEKGVLHK